MILALNVLAAAGLGLTWRFTPAGQVPKQEDAFSALYRDNLAPLITNIVLLSLCPRWLYDYGPKFPALLKLIPKSIRDHVCRARRFRHLMRQLVIERTAQIKTSEVKDNIFLNAIISKSSEIQQKQQPGGMHESSVAEGGLSEEEVFANIVDYNIAGHETTAHTLNYCFHILAVEKKWQDWIQEELDHVFPTGDLPLDPNNMDYGETFYRLKRCLALLVSALSCFAEEARK